MNTGSAFAHTKSTHLLRNSVQAGSVLNLDVTVRCLAD